MQQGRKATRTGWERWLLTCLLACVAVFLPLSLQADDGLPDHISSRGYLMDPDGNLTLGQVEQLPFRPMPQVLALGHTSAVIWLRVDVEPMAARDLVLTLQPPYLEDVRVFLPGTGVDDWQHVRLGTHVPYTERGRSEGHIVVNLPDRARRRICGPISGCRACSTWCSRCRSCMRKRVCSRTCSAACWSVLVSGCC